MGSRGVNRMVGSAIGVTLAGLTTVPAFANSESSYNMPVGVTPLSREIHSLHMLIFWICVAIAVAVFGAMIYSIVKFRKSQGAVADVNMLHSTKAEITWTVIPVMILVLMAIPTARTLIKIEDMRDSELTIKATGYQWKWQYQFLSENVAGAERQIAGVGYYSSLAEASNFARQKGSGIDPNTVENYLLDVDHPLVIPSDTKVRLLLTADDVIHAWWVPAFGMKRDAIPGFVNQLWIKVDAGKEGTYRGQCAELCGRDHGFMPIVVVVKTKQEFAAWLKEQEASSQQAAAPANTTAQVDTTAETAAAPLAAAL
jgi:cytochrome c oxidase subunit 2